MYSDTVLSSHSVNLQCSLEHSFGCYIIKCNFIPTPPNSSQAPPLLEAVSASQTLNTVSAGSDLLERFTSRASNTAFDTITLSLSPSTMASQLVLLLLFALSMVSAIASTTSTGTWMEPTIVYALVTPTTVTVYPANTVDPVDPIHHSLRARQWDVSPSVPVGSHPAWTEPASPWTQPAWSPQPSWAPTPPASQTPAAPTATAAPASSPTNSYESTHQPNPKETLSSGIVAAVVFGGFFAVCLLSALVIVIMRRCVYRKDTSASNDVEMTAGLRPGTSGTVATGGARSTVGSVTQYAPERPRSVLNAAPLPSDCQPLHWPPEEVPGLKVPANVHWSRGRGYQPA